MINNIFTRRIEMKKQLLKTIGIIMVSGMILTGCGNTSSVVSTKTETRTEAETKTDTETKVQESTVNDLVAQTVDTTSEEDFEIRTLDDGTLEIKKYTGTDTDVVIPDTISGKTVTSIGGSAFFMNKTIESVVIPDTVTGIGKQAFDSCTSLQYVKMSSNIKSIGDVAFADTRMTSIELPEGLEEIGELAFSDSAIEDITFPSTLSELKINSMAGIAAEKIVIPGNIKTIGERAFEGSENLKEVKIEDGVEKIDSYAFAHCDSLETVTLPSTLISIDDSFSKCTNLKSVNIPSSVTEIDEDAFYMCDNLTLTVEAGSYGEQYAIDRNIAYVVE
jgi:hypothetical protein